jgi:large subunit ribosomal protein L4
MKIKLLTKSGSKSTKDIELSKSIWDVPMNKDLVAQVIHVYRNNQRNHTAKAKTRGEVSGGGRKPWAQKGTGRARHGSIRSSLWVGGGVAFGPNNYKKMLRVPKKMRDLSLKCLLSDKARSEEVSVISGFDFDKPNTKAMKELLKKVGLLGSKVLVVYDSKIKDRNVLVKSLANIEKIGAINADNLNSYRVMNSGRLLITQNAVKELEERLK